MAFSKNIAQIIQVSNDHMDICDMKYLPGNESKKSLIMADSRYANMRYNLSNVLKKAIFGKCPYLKTII